MTLRSLGKYFHTVRYLKPKQIASRIWFSLHKPAPDLAPAPLVRERFGQWIEPARLQPSLTGPGKLLFCNQEADLDTVGWDNPDIPKLWRYNQHYFEDLVAEGFETRKDWHYDLIARWIRENKPGVGTGWEPYPISRRIINWIKWALDGASINADVLHILAIQARFQSKRIEWHLLGNHILANAVALIFAGSFFEGRDAEGWLRKGLKILDSQLDEQILGDGGHFELSPMYHAIVLRDLLDLYNLAGCYRQINRLQVRRKKWEDIINRMRSWLLAMTHPDGDISFFNDATFGVAPNTPMLESYARRLGLKNVFAPRDGCTYLEKSGYIRLQNSDTVAILDCAPIGPDYQPGHAHADTLSFELSVAGHRLLVNSGVSTYEDCPERLRQRGTAAHNTVMIDNKDSSEVWASFRVARRARVIDLKIEEKDTVITVHAKHDGYYWLKGKPVHERTWRFCSNKLSIEDRIQGEHEIAEARFYIHPAWAVELFGNNKADLVHGKKRVSFNVERGYLLVEKAYYFPGFGKSVPNACLVLKLDEGKAHLTFSWN